MYLVDHLHQRGHRRDPRLGAVALPDRRARPRRTSTARTSTSTPTRAGLPPRLEQLHLQLRPPRGPQLPAVERACYWLDRYHVDGLRVDAVASMLYLDYSRKAGEWIPNEHGGRENLDAIAFLQRLNEDDLPRASPTCRRSPRSRRRGRWCRGRPTSAASASACKWDMGWMHDTLDVLRARPDPPPLPPRRAHVPRAVRVHARTSCCRSRTTRSCTARGRCSARCRATSGSSSRTSGCSSGTSGPSPARSCCSWAASSASGREWNHDHEPRLAPAGRSRRTPACAAGSRDLNRAAPRRSRRCTSSTRPRRVRVGRRRPTPRPTRGLLPVGAPRPERRGRRRCGRRVNLTPMPHKRLPVGVPAAGAWQRGPELATRRCTEDQHGNLGRVRPSPALARSSPDADVPPAGVPSSSGPSPTGSKGADLRDDPRVWPGAPYPQGATWDGEGVNFSLFSEHAAGVDLCLYERPGQRRRKLNRSRSRSGPTPVARYLPTSGRGGSTATACTDRTNRGGTSLQSDKLLLDPYAERSANRSGGTTPSTATRSATRTRTSPRRARQRAGHAEVHRRSTCVHMGEDRRPGRPGTDLDRREPVKGHDEDHLDPAEIRGTYLALAHDPVVEHLLSSASRRWSRARNQFVDDRHLVEGPVELRDRIRSGLAPHHAYATRSVASRSTSTMRWSRHCPMPPSRWSSMSSTTTPPREPPRPTLSLHGIDNKAFYGLPPEDQRHYTDFSETRPSKVSPSRTPPVGTSVFPGVIRRSRVPSSVVLQRFPAGGGN